MGKRYHVPESGGRLRVGAANISSPFSQGATDTDVQAEEGQAKEGAWGYLRGKSSIRGNLPS